MFIKIMSGVKLKADFWDVWSLFNKRLDEKRAVKSESPNGVKYSENDIKQLSQILQKFVKVSWESSDIQRFLDSIVKYFWIIIRYAEQFKHSQSYKHYFVIRMALDVFLYVINTLKLYNDIILKFAKIIDKIVMVFGNVVCVKEFLRLYAVLLSNGGVPKNLVSKHQFLPDLYKLAKNTGDIDTQAVIIEVILRIFKGPELSKFFPEISELPNIEGNNAYQIIRMALDVLNKDSPNIFSINCTEITLDHKTVVEYDVCGKSPLYVNCTMGDQKIGKT